MARYVVKAIHKEGEKPSPPAPVERPKSAKQKRFERRLAERRAARAAKANTQAC